jgi:hypothetical protein
MSVPDPTCKTCLGTGLAPSEVAPPHPPSFKRCGCVLRRDILANVERGYTGLSQAPVLRGPSPLLARQNENLWITSGKSFLAHLRHVAIRQPLTWSFKVVSDAELVTAWLATIALKGGDIIDPDAYTVSTKYLSVPDLVLPPDLVVIRMGVKVARNEAACEVLAEAINTRLHEGKATWLWDEPGHPLNSGHLFWSKEVARSLEGWPRVGKHAPKTAVKKSAGGAL